MPAFAILHRKAAKEKGKLRTVDARNSYPASKGGEGKWKTYNYRNHNSGFESEAACVIVMDV